VCERIDLNCLPGNIPRTAHSLVEQAGNYTSSNEGNTMDSSGQIAPVPFVFSRCGIFRSELEGDFGFRRYAAGNLEYRKKSGKTFQLNMSNWYILSRLIKSYLTTCILCDTPPPTIPSTPGHAANLLHPFSDLSYFLQVLLS
jgi:hypothetical protein